MIDGMEAFFCSHFETLTGRRPYPWQIRLFSTLAEPGEPWPEVVDLPTGAGKTAVVYVWLLALAHSIRQKTFHVPRRLAWVVNRRVVVDQVTSEVELLNNAGLARCPEVADLLRSISRSEQALAISTLRGQHADSGDWSRDPSTPGIVVGTVDMIGSRLLFRGYWSGKYHRPVHASLLGIDTLIVNDEAHLSPAFARLLYDVALLKPAGQISGKTYRFLLLSATHTTADTILRRFEHDPETDAAASTHFEGIFGAPKQLTVVPAEGPKIEALRWKLATDNPAPRTVVFVEQPENAAKFAARLEKENHTCRLLTGTMRGLERDQLVNDPVFGRFLRAETDGEPVWLVATSAGEVGVNLTSERMITDLCEADHLLQRFGRLNRFGSRSTGEAFVLWKAGVEKDGRLQATAEYLSSLAGDISGRALWNHRPPQEARAEIPALARIDSALLDVWAQTSYPDRFVPAVEPYLHGQQDQEVPQTEVAWRADIATLVDWNVDASDISEVLEYFPVMTHERLREPSTRVKDKLTKIFELTEDGAASRRLVLVSTDGSCEITTLADVASAKDEALLRGRLVLLPPCVGSISAQQGMFSVEPAPSRYDVAELSELPTFARFRFLLRDGAISPLLTPEDENAGAMVPESGEPQDLAEFATAHNLKPALETAKPADEGKGDALIYFSARRRSKVGMPKTILLDAHLSRVSATATALSRALGHDDALCGTYEIAGGLHDSGKNRKKWQTAMGRGSTSPIAKSTRPPNLRLLDGYRHEFGSLVDAVVSGEYDDQALLLHLIASHHAGARPYFEERQFDPENLRRSPDIALGAARRFGELQTRYGHWGLAYLEAVLKCADGLASAEEGDATSA